MDSIDIELEERYRCDIMDPFKRAFALSLHGLYQIELAGVDPEAAIQDILPGNGDESLVRSVREFVGGVCANLVELDAIVKEHLTCNWALERLGYIERNVLRLGAFIITRRLWKSVPTVCGVAAQCSVEYGSPNSHGLVMAVLDAIAQSGERE